jgi:hypothetical protein
VFRCFELTKTEKSEPKQTEKEETCKNLLNSDFELPKKLQKIKNKATLCLICKDFFPEDPWVIRFFRFVSKLICLFRFFRLFQYRFKNEPKIVLGGFAKQTENQPKQNEFWVYFGSNRNFFLLVSWTP